MALRKTLPEDLGPLMRAATEGGDDAAVRAALERCASDARGGLGKQTPLMMRECSPALARWLLEHRGVDLEAVDAYGKTALHHSAGARFNHALGVDTLLELGADVHARSAEGLTPLHAAADGKHLLAVQRLLAAGADVSARSRRELTPLEYALQRASNIDLPALVPVARTLLEAGAERSEAAREFVRLAAERFEFHRSGFAPDRVTEVSNAATTLCEMFGVQAPAARAMHDGRSPIVAKSERWQDRHAELWDLLVPSSGACTTVQGEVVRIAGRVSDELYRNGGANWDADYRAMVTALMQHVRSHAPLEASQLNDLDAALARLPRDAEATRELARASVDWVALNPTPIALSPPPYRR